ncbi:hypothetical protein V8E36_005916 [Tilletia maclaganii]
MSAMRLAKMIALGGAMHIVVQVSPTWSALTSIPPTVQSAPIRHESQSTPIHAPPNIASQPTWNRKSQDTDMLLSAEPTSGTTTSNQAALKSSHLASRRYENVTMSLDPTKDSSRLLDRWSDSAKVQMSRLSGIMDAFGATVASQFNFQSPPVLQPKRSCFPALDFKMPNYVPSTDALDGWWCDMRDEYAFMGFSYDLSSCPSLRKLRNDFGRMRYQFHARYVRLYSACDRPGLNDDLVTAAWENGLGLHLLIWFGFDGGNEWHHRKRDILRTIKNNPRAPFVVRAVVVGSEPLFDSVMPPGQLAAQIMDVKQKLSAYTGKGLRGMQVTLSDMPYAFQSNGNAPSVFRAMDIIEGNILPFFDQHATTGGQAWPFVSSAYTYFQQQARGKKVLYTQIGWPSDASVWKPNSPRAVASVKSERAFYNLMERNCEWFKAGAKGGIGWFAHIWDDNGLPGWGILDYSDNLKFDFAPRTSC